MVPLLALIVLAAAPAAEPARLAPLPAAEWTLDAADHLLARAGFAGTPAEVRRLHRRGLDGAVDWLLAVAAQPERRFLAESFRGAQALGRGLEIDPEQRQALRRQMRREDGRQAQAYREFWLERMLSGHEPLREKMALFWHGHFTSAQREVKDSAAMARQIELYRAAGLGSFGSLLEQASKEPAMLTYLDGRRNKKGSPNENFAREVMELFTMGPGNYGEEDIHAAARAFTGWTVGRDGEFRFNRGAHDGGEKEFLGRRGAFDGEAILAILMAEEATARFVATRLFEFFVRPAPEPELVDELAAGLAAGGHEIAPFLRTLLRSREFYAASSRGALIKSPVEFVVQTVRRLGVEPPGADLLTRFLDQLGQSLLDPPNVKGWEGGATWINASTLLDRANLARLLVRGVDAGLLEEMAAARGSGGNQAGAGVPAAYRQALRRNRGWRPEPQLGPRVVEAATSGAAVEALCERFLPVAPAPEVVQLLRRQVAPHGDDQFAPGDRQGRRRLLAAVEVVLSLPEYQLN